jgi:aspartyl/asparaginyl-tRNA synthetase
VNDDGRTVAAMDVLAPGIGEITGGSQREEPVGRGRQLRRSCPAAGLAVLPTVDAYNDMCSCRTRLAILSIARS